MPVAVETTVGQGSSRRPNPNPADIQSADGDAGEICWQLGPSRRRVVGAVARRLVPYLVEATIIPTALFYVLLVLGDMRSALAGALIWSYGAVVRRVVSDHPVPALLILATLGITVRTTVYLLSNNDFVYFVQPILRTTLTGLMFAGSVALGPR